MAIFIPSRPRNFVDWNEKTLGYYKTQQLQFKVQSFIGVSTHKKRIFLCIGSQGQTPLARGMEEGDTSFPSKTDLMAYFYLLI